MKENDFPFDEIVVFVAFILMYELLMFLWCSTLEDTTKKEWIDLKEDKYVTTNPETPVPSITPTPVVEYVSHLEETPEFSAVMYATEPIGRYYITAYNHLETGNKLTASGATCHEGTITTCAADPRCHKFGTYLEIGRRLYRVEDTGSAVKKRHIDLYFSDYKTMSKYNSHYENIYRVSFPFGMPKD